MTNAPTRTDNLAFDPQEVDFVWPLTGELAHIDWEALTEEIRIRDRLAEIVAHVQTTHVVPRVRRIHPHAPAALAQAIRQEIIAGPDDAPLWAQRLREPVPRRLREEWAALVARLRELHAGV